MQRGKFCSWKKYIGVIGAIGFFWLSFGSNGRTIATIDLEPDTSAFTATVEERVPSLVDKDGLVLQVKLGEGKRPYNFLLDTGAEISVLDSAIVQDLALNRLLDLESHDFAGNSKKVTLYQSKSLTVGSATIYNIPILSVDMKFLQTTYGIPIDGLLGYDFLKHFVVNLDYKNHQVIFSRTNHVSIPSDALMAMMHKNYFAVTLPITIDHMSMDVLLDTGAMGEAFAAPNDLLEKCKIKIYSKGGIVAGAFGYSERDIMARAEVRVGKYTFKNTSIMSSQLPLAGHKFLSQFNVILDYPDQKAWLIPNGKVLLPRDSYHTGLGLVSDENGFLVVRGIWEGSPADVAAIGVGDRILAINGIKTPAQTEAYWRVILHDDKIKTLELVIQNSAGIRTITLKKCNLFAVHRVKTLKR